MRSRLALLAVALVMVSPATHAADLVVWWEQGYYAQEDEAVREIVAAFEQDIGKQVEVTFYPQPEHPGKVAAAVEAGQPPDFAFGLPLANLVSEWALDDRLVDLSDAIGHFSDLFDPELLNRAMLLNARTGQKALYALPMGRATNHLHVWKSLLEQAGFTLEDIPKEWDTFWSFWCHEVQPAMRRATSRDDIWSVGLPLSINGNDTTHAFQQFMSAYRADYVTRDGRLVIDDPEIRRQLVKAVDSYTAIYRKDCTPPGSLTWADADNNKSFLAQAIVMTPNETLSIPNALKHEHPDDYYKNTATIEWPLGPSGDAFPIEGHSSAPWSSRMAAMSPPRRSSSVFLSARAG